MAEIEVRLMLPVDHRIVTVELEDSMTSDEIISELYANDIVQRTDSGYQLGVKGSGEIMNANTQLKDLTLDENSVIQVIPATDAG